MVPTLDLMHKLKLDSHKAGLPSHSRNETFYLSKSTAFAGAQTALKVFQEIAGNTGVPGLQNGVKALTTVLDVMQVW